MLDLGAHPLGGAAGRDEGPQLVALAELVETEQDPSLALGGVVVVEELREKQVGRVGDMAGEDDLPAVLPGADHVAVVVPAQGRADEDALREVESEHHPSLGVNLLHEVAHHATSTWPPRTITRESACSQSSCWWAMKIS
ncbi:hypothetical protein D3C87_1571390 [compost metagenome]